MKKIQAVKVRIAIFIFLIVLAIALVVPTHKRLVTFADGFVGVLSNQLEQNTGLKLSYSSLSPSVLSTFSISDIKLSDKDDKTVISINKTKVNYNIIDLLKKNLQKGIHNITIDGISLDVDRIVEIIQLVEKKETETTFDYKQIKTKIPGLVKLKNISLNYDNSQVAAELLFKEISINNNSKRENLSFVLDSRLYANLLGLNKKFSGNLLINGTIPDSFENSLVNFKFDNLTDGTYKLSNLNLMATYAHSKLDIHTIQTVNPISITAGYDVVSGLASAEIKAEKLSPLSVISSNQKKLDSLKNILVDTDTKLYCDVFEKQMNYSSQGQFYLPDSVFHNGLEVSYELAGNEKELDLQYLDLNGTDCSANVNLTYLFETMQVSGFAELPYLILPDGKTISTELYIDPLDKGFLAFSPQIFMGDKALTALQLSFMPQPDSYDFVVETFDYTHADKAEPGQIKLDGSFLPNNSYIQGGVSLNSLYMDSIVEFAEQFVDNATYEKISSVKDFVSDYMFSGDIYLSTDLKSLSFSMPYLLLANTSKDNQFIMLAANGNDQSIQLNQLSFISGKYALQASGSVDRNPGTKDLFFVTDINADSVPYHFSGSIMPEVITVTGDYGTDVEVRLASKNNMSGHANLKDLPFSFQGTSIILSTQADFTYDLENGPAVAIKQLEVEEASAESAVSPKLMLSGNVTKYGAQIDSIAYTDFYSALEGTADVMVNINEGIFDSVGLLMNLKNPLSEEAISMDATISNPEHLSFVAESLKDSLYINSQVQIHNFGLNRFATQKNDNNLLSLSLFASGTINHPYVALSIEDFSYIMAGNFFKTWGSLTLEDKLLSINNLGIDFQGMKTNDITATFSLENFEGSANGSFEAVCDGKDVYVPIDLSVTNTVLKPGKLLPESTLITISSKEVGGPFIKKGFGFDISALYADGNFTLFSSDNLGLFGNFYSDGSMSMSINSLDKVKMTITGVMNKNETNIKLGNIFVDLEHAFSFFDFDETVLVDGGTLTGSVSILNSLDDPILKGALMVENPEARLPSLIPRRITAPKTLITVINNEIRIHDTEYFVRGSNSAYVGAIVYMNKWNVDHTEATVKTKGKNPVAIRMANPAFVLSGDVVCNLKFYLEGMDMDATGTIFAEGVTLNSTLGQLTGASEEMNNGGIVRTDLDILLGNHAVLNFDPLLRCVFVPNTHIGLKMDTETNQYEIDGLLAIKSGDIAYLNRSFYIKEGSIKFSKSDFANPQVTITAETRERDERGENVRIILSAENQYLLNFTPKFSSVPAKSENEIRQLLGQIVVADADSAANFLLSAGDYALQSAIVRKAENKLREVLNFDIFSMRTNVLQNTLNLSASGNLSRETLTIGNFLDNSTVYVGKYLGSSLYLDAMIHFSFEDTFARDISTAGNLVFQPEFGLEMESPFGNIRWNVAPDINALLNNQFVPSSSVTLSWKHSF